MTIGRLERNPKSNSSTTLSVYLSGARSSAIGSGEVCIANFVESGCGVGAAAGVVEAQCGDHRLTTIVISQVELTERLHRVGDGADTHVA